MDAASSPTLSRAAATEASSVSFLRAGWELLLLPVVVLLAVIPQYTLPIQYNEAMFVVFGREILEGALPYRDVFDQKPPLIYYFYAVVQGLTGDGFLVTRMLIFVSLGVTAMLTTLIAREFYGRRLAFLAGLAFALSTGFVAITENAGLDQLTLLPLAASIYGVLRWRRQRNTTHLVVAGITLALALLLKPVAMPTAMLLAAVVLGRGGNFHAAAVLTASTLAVGVLAVLAMAALRILPEAYDAVIVFGREYGAVGWQSVDIVPRLAFWGLSLSALLLPAAASLIVFAFRRDFRFWFLGGLLAAGLIEAALPGRFYAYYATMATLPLALLGPGIFEWMARQRRAVRLAVAAPGAFVFALAVYVAAALPAELSGDSRYEAVATAIAAETKPGDRIWVRANHPQIYYYAGLRPAHRYFTAQFTTRAGAEDQTVAQLTAAPPRFIVIDDREDFEPLLALLEARYDALVSENRITAYRRRD